MKNKTIDDLLTRIEKNITKMWKDTEFLEKEMRNLNKKAKLKIKLLRSK